MNAPTMPTTMFSSQPCRALLPTIMLAIQPAIAPRMIHKISPMPRSLAPALRNAAPAPHQTEQHETGARRDRALPPPVSGRLSIIARFVPESIGRRRLTESARRGVGQNELRLPARPSCFANAQHLALRDHERRDSSTNSE